MNLKSRNRIDPNFQMSSLTDIIFLLLIFFLLTSSLVSVNALEILLPSSNSSTSIQEGVTISITGDKQYYYNKEKIEFEQLEGLLAGIAQNANAEGGEADPTNTPVPSVTLYAERSVAWEEVVKVVDLSKRLGLQIIAATNPE